LKSNKLPTLSIVIVNYNVKYFLASCIESILKSDLKIEDLEIIVIDNASKENCQSMLENFNYPNLRYIYNTKNIGFGRANNQGFKLTQGKYVLALNPDTIIGETTLSQCIKYLDVHQDIGALGVKMIDGGGRYLKESKRGLPTLWNSITKFSGLSSIFPNNKLFNGYYLGHLSKDENHEIQILCGAFLMVRSEILQKTKGFDEDFFMYGEDIDLSVRIKKLGYKIGYFSETSIIHFKGESSHRSSIHYIKNFYNAMLIFVDKNYRGLEGMGLRFFIKMAILFFGIISFIRNNIIHYFHIILDGFILYYCFEIMKKGWGQLIYSNVEYFNNEASKFNSIGAMVVWLISLWFFGHYDKDWKWNRLFIGLSFGTLFILLIYSLLPDYLRSSRAMILLGNFPLMAIAYCTMLIRKNLFYTNKVINEEYHYEDQGNNDINKLNALVKGIVIPLRGMDGLDILEKFRQKETINHLIVNPSKTNYGNLIKSLESNEGRFNVYFTNDGCDYLIGSKSSNHQGRSVNSLSNYNLNSEFYLRIKRLFDMVYTLLNFFKFNTKYTKSDLYEILIGRKSWVGYSNKGNIDQELPVLKPCIYSLEILVNDDEIFPKLNDESIANHYYGRHYSFWLDYKICSKNQRKS
jgi:O-antigen biosynthesis protein